MSDLLYQAQANKRLRGEMLEQSEREEIRNMLLYGEWRPEIKWEQPEKFSAIGVWAMVCLAALWVAVIVGRVF